MADFPGNVRGRNEKKCFSVAYYATMLLHAQNTKNLNYCQVDSVDCSEIRSDLMDFAHILEVRA